jgi:hypothetical protein
MTETTIGDHDHLGLVDGDVGERVGPRLHHVNLSVVPGGVEAETAFLVEVLGYTQLVVDDELRELGAIWFETTDGTQIHLSEDPEHHPAAKAHVAVDFGDRLGAVKQRLDERAIANDVFGFREQTQVGCCDPAGNRWELRGVIATPE